MDGFLAGAMLVSGSVYQKLSSLAAHKAMLERDDLHHLNLSHNTSLFSIKIHVATSFNAFQSRPWHARPNRNNGFYSYTNYNSPLMAVGDLDNGNAAAAAAAADEDDDDEDDDWSPLQGQGSQWAMEETNHCRQSSNDLHDLQSHLTICPRRDTNIFGTSTGISTSSHQAHLKRKLPSSHGII